MRKERISGIITIVMTVAFFITLLWGYGQYQQNRRAMALLENEYQRAYYNYLANVKDMAITAGKAQNASALQRAVLLERLSFLAASAAEHMSILPVQHSRYQQSVSYLNQVGDYAASLNLALARGQTLSQQEQQNLTAIYQQLQDICAQMVEMETAVSGGSIVFAASRQGGSWWQATRQALTGGSRAVQGMAAAIAENTADGFFSRADALLDDAEPLRYNGKYSAHLSNPVAWGLYGKRQVTEAEALNTAQQFLTQAGWQNLMMTAQEEAAFDVIPLYLFRFSGNSAEENFAAGDIYVAVSRAGGAVVSFVSERLAAPGEITAETAIANAESLLKFAGYDNMRLVSRQALEGELLLQYVNYQNSVLYYPDRVDIKVALDDGRVTALNAREYWMNLCERPLPQNMRAVEDALAGLGEDAQVSGTALAFISDGAGGGKFCHEIRHMQSGEEYLTYICVEQLTEEQVLRGYTAEDGSFYTR